MQLQIKKGGGKTTTAVNLGAELIRQGKRVLVIDADPQGSLTISLGIKNSDKLNLTLANVMQSIVEDKELTSGFCLLKTEEGIDLMPSNIELSGIEIRLVNEMIREKVLKTYVFVDCTDEENDLISQIALRNAHEVIMVLSPDLKSMVYLASNEELFGNNAERAMRILNVNENELYSPVDDVRTNVKNIAYILPYSKQIRGQHLDGLLYERAKDKKYRTELSKIINRIM